MSKTHRLKILPKWFRLVRDGIKNFEVRRNDRDFKVGDILALEEWFEGYTGCTIYRQIIYIIRADEIPEAGDMPVLHKDYVILGIH